MGRWFTSFRLYDVYFYAGYSAGSETERAALKKRPETQNLHPHGTSDFRFAPRGGFGGGQRCLQRCCRWNERALRLPATHARALIAPTPLKRHR